MIIYIIVLILKIQLYLTEINYILKYNNILMLFAYNIIYDLDIYTTLNVMYECHCIYQIWMGTILKKDKHCLIRIIANKTINNN